MALCRGGRYSPFDTIWVGIGIGADAASAPATRRCSRSLSQLLIIILPVDVAVDQCWWLRASGRALGQFRFREDASALRRAFDHSSRNKNCGTTALES
jgi:hypothetical protein